MDWLLVTIAWIWRLTRGKALHESVSKPRLKLKSNPKQGLDIGPTSVTKESRECHPYECILCSLHPSWSSNGTKDEGVNGGCVGMKVGSEGCFSLYQYQWLGVCLGRHYSSRVGGNYLHHKMLETSAKGVASFIIVKEWEVGLLGLKFSIEIYQVINCHEHSLEGSSSEIVPTI